ncbi:MAG: HD-GYP domain-containing protein, partial [Eubacteriales bacterium]
YVLSISVILYSFARKNQISRKVLGLLFFPESLAVIAFFLGKQMPWTIELLPLVYVVAQINYLMIVARIALYDITDTAIDSLVKKGDTGFIAIDYGYHYLGSNDTAKEIFPILSKLTVDLSVRRRKSFGELVTPWLEDYRQDRSKNAADYEKDGKIYRIIVSPLYNGKKEKGYQLTVTDNTRDQQYIRFIKGYNDRLTAEVERQTAHIREMHNRLILGMATMVESRDNSTGGHIRRTSEGVKILLGEMTQEEFPELTKSFREKLIKAAPMHDLGKIAVDDVILRKPGRFTPEEFEKMKEHAAAGSRIVHEILKDTDDDEFHVIAESVAQFHHERWDGSGYPDGLKGEEIPLEARIMAVADVYDALVSKRVYKESMSFEKADQIMMEGMGSQFAPEMKDVYCRARPKLEAYYSSLE